MANFYWYLRPWVVVLRFLGLFPLDNVTKSDPTYLSFGTFHFSNIYSFCVFSTCVFFVVYFSEVAFCTTSPEEKCKQMVLVVTSLRSLISLYFYIVKSKHFPNLIKLLHSYDQQKFNFFLDENSSWFRNFIVWCVLPIICSFLVFFTFCVVSALIVQDILMESIRYTKKGYLSSMSFGILSMWHTFPICLYLYKAMRICSNFSELNDSLKKRINIKNYTDNQNPNIDFDTIAEYRYLHNMLSECVHQLSIAYGMFLVVDLLAVICVSVISIVLFALVDRNNISMLNLSVFSLALALIGILVSQKIKEKVSL